MTSIEFINKQIEVTKKQLIKYPLSKEQSDPNYKHKEADIQYIHNKYYTEQLQILQQIKEELEVIESIRLCVPQYIILDFIPSCDYKNVKKVLEDKHYD